MPRKTLLLLIGVIVIVLAAMAPLAWDWYRDRSLQRVQETSPWSSPDAAAELAPSQDLALAASRELACIDRVLAGAFPQHLDVETALEECRRLGDAGQHSLAGQ